MQQFNFLKYIFDKEEYEYLKDFESDLSNIYYSHYLLKGKKVPLSRTKLKNIFSHQVLSLVGLFNIFLKKEMNSIISDAYFNFNDKLRDAGYKVSRPPWVLNRKQLSAFDYSIHKDLKYITSQIDNGLQRILSDEFLNYYQNFISNIESYIEEHNSLALFLPADVSFHQKVLIKAFKTINRPSFIHLHGGMPASYKPYRFNSTDYLLVWGEKHKENYISNGFDENKIIITGHPLYSNLHIKNSDLRFSLDRVLIISKSMLGAQKNDGIIRLQDKANSLLYLFQIKDVLLEFGVESVSLRLHPSEDDDFIFRNIDTSFFKMENGNLEKALKKATLVIGSKSTVFIESLIYGVNYILYEPQINGKDMNGIELTSPFSEDFEKIPYAYNVDDLKYIIKSRLKVNSSVLSDYIKPNFSLSEVNAIIESYK